MDQKSNLEIVVTAKDDASSTLQNIGSEAKATGTSFLSMSGAVAAGQAAFAALKSAGTAVIGFLEESVSAAAQAEAQMAIVKQNVINAGLSFDEIGPKIHAYSEAMQKLGFDNEDTAASLSKFVLITGSYTEALKLNQLAMDLARGKGVDLATATNSVAMIMQGAGGRALMQYGISIKDSATTVEVLNEAQRKLAGDSAAWAESSAGQLEQVKLGWEDIKKEVGNDLLPVVKSFIQIMKDGMPAVRGLVEGVADTFQKLADNIHGVADYFKIITGGYDHYVRAADEVKTTTVEATNTFDESFGRLTSTAISHAKAIESLGTDYKKMRDDAKIALSELSDTFESEMANINDSIKKTEQQQKDLKAAFSAGAVSDAASLADKIVASEKNIRDLKTKILAESDTMKRSQLEGQLSDEQKNYDSSLQFRTDNAAAITEAERRAGETQLQRDVEDYNSRRAIATQEYTQRMADLEDAYKQEVKKKDETVALYAQRKQAITAIMNQGNTDFKALSDERVQMTKDEVDQEIKYFQSLASAISGLKGASKSSISNISVPVSPRANGGPVSPYSPYIVGEQGPELFVPSSMGSIVPNGGGGRGDVNITIGNLYGTDESAARQLANSIADILTKQLKLRTI